MDEDPLELHDLADDIRFKYLLDSYEVELKSILNVELTDALCRHDQKIVVDRFGGYDHFDEQAKWKHIGTPVPKFD